MSLAALDSTSMLDGGWLVGAVLVSLFLHGSLAASVARLPERVREEPVWVEMIVTTVEPVEVPPEPEPEPEPEKPPEVVEYEKPPEVAPPVVEQAKPVPRVLQGLNQDSFLDGPGTGFNARAGTTTAAPATQELMEVGEATDSVIVPFASLTNIPKVRFKPTLEIPQSVVDARVEGRVELVLTIDATGVVIDLEVVVSLHPDADAACVDAMKKSRWKPGDKDGAPVVTRNVPYSCRFGISPGG